MSGGDRPRPRAVLDANVLVRFFLTPRGGNARLLTAIDEDAFALVTSESILAEVRDVLGRPRVQRYGPFSATKIDEAIAALREKAVVAAGEHEVALPLKDPKDRHVLACAVNGQADYVVTDDRRDLQPLGTYEGISIVSPPRFLGSVLGRPSPLRRR